MEVKANWFGFELNHQQSVLLLSVAFIGLLNILFGILAGVNALLDTILYSIPAHLAQPAIYTIYYVFDDFKSSLLTITVYLSFFLLCVYTIRKICKNDPNSIFKHKSSQKQITRWFGFKLNHLQSILLFLLSLIGIIASVSSLLRGLDSYPYSIFFNDFFPNWDRYFQRGLFAGFHLTFIVMSLYTLVKMKMNYKRSQVNLDIHHPTSFLIIFIVSIIIVIIMIFRLFTLLYIPMNSYDLPATFLLLMFSSIIASFFFLRKIYSPLQPQIPIIGAETIEHKKKKNSAKLSLIVLIESILIYAILYFGFFTTHFALKVYVNHFFLDLVLGAESYTITYFLSRISLVLNLFLVSIPLFIILYYFFGRQRIEKKIKELELKIDKKWMRLNIKIKSHAIILFWISLAQLLFLLIYAYALIPHLLDPFGGTYSLFRNIILLILIGAISAFCCYNLKSLYYAQKLLKRSPRV